MDEANAECAAWDEEEADRKYEADIAVMVAAVRKHAKANYNSGGWDFVVECWEDSDIRDVILDAPIATSVEDVIRLVGEIVAVSDDRRKDVMAEAGYDREQEVSDMLSDLYPTHNSDTLCTCQDIEDECPYHSYIAWKKDLSETGPICQDSGYKVLSQSKECDDDYKTRCFLTPQEFQEEYDDLPF